MKTILVPVDFSRTTRLVVDCATELARSSGAKVMLLNVTSPASLLEDHRKLEELEERVFARSSPDRGRVGRLTGDSLEFVGDPASVILEQAQRLAADYIVMGARRPMRASKKAFGATAGGVIRGASCPVILVPAPKPKRQQREKIRHRPAPGRG